MIKVIPTTFIFTNSTFLNLSLKIAFHPASIECTLLRLHFKNQKIVPYFSEIFQNFDYLLLLLFLAS